MWLALTAAALAGGVGLAVAACVARPALVIRLLSFAASGATGVLVVTATAHRAPAVAQAFAPASFGLTVLALAIGVWHCSSGGGDDTGGDGGGGGGNGRWPPRSPDPELEPDWWPAFEREFRAYAAAHASCGKVRRGSRTRRQ